MQKKSYKEPRQAYQDVQAVRHELRRACELFGRLDRYKNEHDEWMPEPIVRALLALYERRERPPTLTELGAALDVDKSNITRLCQRLNAKGLTVLERDSEDRRAKRLSLSDKGIKLAHQMEARGLERLGCVLADMRHDQLLHSLSTLCDAMEESVSE